MSGEDIIRRCIIQSIMCRNELDYGDIESRFELDFQSHFSDELGHIRQQHEDGLLVANEHGFKVTPAGRLLLRNIAMVFDAYLSAKRDWGHALDEDDLD